MNYSANYNPLYKSIYNGLYNDSAEVPVDGPTLAFHALTPDDTTYEMLGVKTGTGGITVTHTATLYAPDLDGVYRGFAANEAVYSGGRKVTNYVWYSENLTVTGDEDTGWRNNNGTVTTGITDPDGGTSAIRYERTGAGSALFYQRPDVPIGVTCRFSAWVRRESGTGAVRFYQGNGTNRTLITAVLTSSWQRITIDTAVNASAVARIGLEVAILNDEIDFWRPQLEYVGGAANDSPGEYVATTTTTPVTKVFANENGNTVLSNVVTEAVGSDLSETPYLQYYPTATNDATYSNDLTNAVWAQTGTGAATLDQAGLTDEPNTATTLTDTDAAVLTNYSQERLDLGSAATVAEKVWIRKQGSYTATVQVNLAVGGLTPVVRVQLNPFTGEIFNRDPGVGGAEVIDVGDWWLIVYDHLGTGGFTNYYLTVYPAINTSGADGTTSVSATGSCIVGNAEIHLNKTIAEVRGLGPIFTTTAAVSVDTSPPEFDYTNWDSSGRALYIEYSPDSTTDSSDGPIILGLNNGVSVGPIYKVSGDRLASYDTAVGSVSVVNAFLAGPGLDYQCGAVFNTGEDFQCNVDGTWSDAKSYTSFFDTGTLNCFYNEVYIKSSARIRELRFYDITDFAEGKDTIDTLMALPQYEAFKFKSGTNVAFTDGEHVHFES